ncbi:hypothetical protein [Hydrogenophaga sp. 5NK40-0174]|uniref:hypothetical protein n=1 Tax=Hydrogenophaga sp. 5NK40-0174 TaxID=3127649 RepID=UPI003109AFB6
MLVPSFWAEATRHKPRGGREDTQVTVLRFGWSNASQADAQAMAEQRVEQAFQEILAGEPLERFERRVAYNGADGLPIREEVLSRFGREGEVDEVVITRNSYGAHCLNTPSVLFADVDLNEDPPSWFSWAVFAVLVVLSVLVSIALRGALAALVLIFVSAFAAKPLARVLKGLMGGAGRTPEDMALTQLSSFLSLHPSWGVRAYRTPKGLRMLVTHRTFAPDEGEVQGFFSSLGADELYVRMCRNQRCFRARLSPKPWRIGMERHIVPRRATWPVTDTEKLARRKAWVEEYEEKAKAYAACRFLGTYGKESIHVDVAQVVRMHDQACRALSTNLPLA